LSEEELIDRVIEKLRPQIVELVKGKSSEVSSVPASDFLTPMSQSAFGYLSSKFNKFEYILSQIMCDLMTSNIDPKNLKTENELISTIVFKIFTLLPEGGFFLVIFYMICKNKRILLHFQELYLLMPRN